MIMSEEEQQQAEALESVSRAVLVALSGVEESSGVERAVCAAELLARLSIIFHLQRAGPQAARDVMVRIYHDLLQDIAASNGGATEIN
jgi:hypothetical protein